MHDEKDEKDEEDLSDPAEVEDEEKEEWQIKETRSNQNSIQFDLYLQEQTSLRLVSDP